MRVAQDVGQDLVALATRKVMRADLLYRIDVVRLEIPPLRQRPDDIIFLAEHFLALAARSFLRDVRGVGLDARDVLARHRWAGNVRELRNCIFESVLRCPHRRLGAADLRLRPPATTVNRIVPIDRSKPRSIQRNVRRSSPHSTAGLTRRVPSS